MKSPGTFMACTRDGEARARAGITVSSESAARMRLMRLCIWVKPPCEKSVERRCLDAPAAGTWPAGLQRGFEAHLLSRSGAARTCEKPLHFRAKEPRSEEHTSEL